MSTVTISFTLDGQTRTVTADQRQIEWQLAEAILDVRRGQEWDPQQAAYRPRRIPSVDVDEMRRFLRDRHIDAIEPGQTITVALSPATTIEVTAQS